MRAASPDPAGGPRSRWLMAQRARGADLLRLDLYVEGAGADLRIYVYGTDCGESRELVHEVNALRRALRGRFERLCAGRSGA